MTNYVKIEGGIVAAFSTLGANFVLQNGVMGRMVPHPEEQPAPVFTPTDPQPDGTLGIELPDGFQAMTGYDGDLSAGQIGFLNSGKFIPWNIPLGTIQNGQVGRLIPQPIPDIWEAGADMPGEWVAVADDAPWPKNGSTYANGTFTDPAPAAMPWAVYQQLAQAALNKSDLTVLRCVETGTAVPSGWAAYRTALRAIVSATSGDATQPLPTRPAYP